MRTLLNIIWVIFAGFWLFLGWMLAGIVMCILIVTIPFGIQAFKIGMFSLWPFGRTVVKKESAGGWSVVGNIVWLVLAGWWLAIGYIVTAAALAITIIGIPLAIGNIKLVPVALWPFGREIVETDEVVGAFTASRAD